MNALPETQAAADEFARQQGMPSGDLTLVERFKSKVLNFSEALQNLQSRKVDAARYPDLAAQQRDLISRGDALKRTISVVTSAVDKVFSFFRGVTGMDGLGVIPLLPVAAITVVVGAMTKWVTHAYEFGRRLDAIAALEAKGYSPERAGEIVKGQLPDDKPFGGFGLDVSAVLPWVAMAGVLYFIWRGGAIR